MDDGDADELKKGDLIERVAAASGRRRGEVKPVVEAMLGVMGQALSDGAQLNLQPFGKMRVVRARDLPNGQALTVKLRRSGASLAQTGRSGAPDASDAPGGLAERDGEG